MLALLMWWKVKVARKIGECQIFKLAYGFIIYKKEKNERYFGFCRVDVNLWIYIFFSYNCIICKLLNRWRHCGNNTLFWWSDELSNVLKCYFLHSFFPFYNFKCRPITRNLVFLLPFTAMAWAEEEKASGVSMEQSFHWNPGNKQFFYECRSTSFLILQTYTRVKTSAFNFLWPWRTPRPTCCHKFYPVRCSWCAQDLQWKPAATFLSISYHLLFLGNLWLWFLLSWTVSFDFYFMILTIHAIVYWVFFVP